MLLLPPLPLLAFAAASVPLPHAPGDGKASLRSDTFIAGWAYDDDGNTVADDDGFVKETITLAGEVGVAPHLTLDASLPLVFRPEPGVGDFDIGGLIQFLEGDVDLALSLDLKVPLYAGTPSVRGRDPITRKPAIGDGQADITGAFLFVAQLPADAAMHLYAGYRFRGGNVSDAVVGGGRIGMWFLDRFLFASVLLDTVVTFDAGPGEVTGAGYAAFGPKLSARVFERVFVDISALYVGRGKNAAGGADLGVGLSAQF